VLLNSPTTAMTSPNASTSRPSFRTAAVCEFTQYAQPFVALTASAMISRVSGSSFDFLPIARHRDGYEELFGTPTGLDLAKVADLYGTGFTRVRSYADLPGALSRPGLVEIPLDRARNVELHRALFDRASAAARTAVEPA